MPSQREHLAAAVIGSTIYVVGGRVTSDHPNYWRTTTNSNGLEAHDPSAEARRDPVATRELLHQLSVEGLASTYL